MTPRRRNESPLRIEDLDVEAILPSTGRLRQSTERQIRSLTRSICRFGFVSPLVVDQDYRLIAGEVRLEAAKRLGLASLPVIVLRHLDPAEAKALSIALNRIQELGKWDEDHLRTSILEILNHDIDFDFTAIGFETPEIDVLLDASAATGNEDVLPHLAIGQAAVTRAGDLWALCDHRIYCGSALDQASYASVLGESRAKAAITDPPYNVKIDGHARMAGSNHREFKMGSGEMSSEAFTEFLTEAFGLLVSASVDGSLHFVFMDWRHLEEILAAGKAAYTELKNLVVWNKTVGGMGSFYRSQHELVLVFKSGTAPHTNNVNLGMYGRYRTNVWNHPSVNIGPNRTELLAIHPTVKPVALIADAIRDCTEPGDLVLDPFAGSGTILLAAENTWRRAAAIELDPLYVDVAIRRWQAGTGKTAVHCGTRQTFAEREAQISSSPAADVEGRQHG
jgi:DNA modification methylase